MRDFVKHRSKRHTTIIILLHYYSSPIVTPLFHFVIWPNVRISDSNRFPPRYQNMSYARYLLLLLLFIYLDAL